MPHPGRAWPRSGTHAACGDRRAQRLGTVVRGPDHPDVPLPTEKRPHAVSRRMVIVHDEQIDLASGARAVAIPAIGSLTFKFVERG